MNSETGCERIARPRCREASDRPTSPQTRFHTAIRYARRTQIGFASPDRETYPLITTVPQMRSCNPLLSLRNPTMKKPMQRSKKDRA